jgi:hypothetical protein
MEMVVDPAQPVRQPAAQIDTDAAAQSVDKRQHRRDLGERKLVDPEIEWRGPVHQRILRKCVQRRPRQHVAIGTKPPEDTQCFPHRDRLRRIGAQMHLAEPALRLTHHPQEDRGQQQTSAADNGECQAAGSASPQVASAVARRAGGK